MIRFDDVSKAYPDGTPALSSVSFDILPGEFVSLVGASGAGKSTLLKLIYSEVEPTSGAVSFNGRDLSTINRKHLPYYRRNIGTVFQDFKLLPQKTAFENVAYALEVYGSPTDEILDEVPQILDIVDLGAKAGNLPKQLSGGEQQRVAIARALILQPKIIIADEPTGNLDPVSAEGIIDLLLEINQLGTTVILATHNQALVNKVGRRVIALDRGRVASDEMEGRYVFPGAVPAGKGTKKRTRV
ncbi:MAG: cell division ATP-binding protein FtsE [Candidatus Moranbacteria bacterium]|nr:cell division ATP-binding protein FtsE [Candidatus Moranbacteria bacterium]NTW45700.1 cell division ATP-binding protein FtsE [Candidatus Moranbacteria bacterium]